MNNQELVIALAVLGACSTAASLEEDTVAPQHLAHALLRAGVGAVLAVRWKLDHEAGSAMLRRFHASLAGTGKVLTSYRAAALEGIYKSEGKPYYWAGMSVFF